jgi:EAL domain-containing protein (putative c-di-GMP-specific phosphodiesterase class I)
MVAPDQLSVVFQPIVSLRESRTLGHEALVRCRVPLLSSPLVLFERAVDTGCAGRLGRLIREIAVPLSESRPLFVNVHPLELSDGWLVRPDDPIFSHDSDVYLEITESVPITHFALAERVLREVRARGGIHLVIDDLGATTSNLKRIADLAPRMVKLSRELVAGIDVSPRQQRLVASVVRLCERLECDVIAEGVETVGEHVALRDAGVHYAQGYLFARPWYPTPTPHIP